MMPQREFDAKGQRSRRRIKLFLQIQPEQSKTAGSA